MSVTLMPEKNRRTFDYINGKCVQYMRDGVVTFTDRTSALYTRNKDGSVTISLDEQAHVKHKGEL